MAHQPQNLVAIATSSTTIDLSWDDVETLEDEFYDLERDGVIIESSLAATTFSDTGLEPDTEYTYRVRAVGGTENPDANVTPSTVVAASTVLTIGVSSAFSPDDIAGLVAWYTFDDIDTVWQDTARTSAVTADGQMIKGVTDASGNGIHLSEATNGPTYKAGVNGLNGLSVGLGSGSTLVNGPTLVLAQPFTIFVSVQHTTGVGGAEGVLCGRSYTPQIYAKGDDFWAYYAGTEQPGSVAVDTTTRILACKFNGASSAMYVNGGTAATTANPGTGGLATGEFRIFSLSDASHQPGNSLPGKIGEVVIYDSALSTTDINLVGNYLERWGPTWTDV